MLNKADYKLLVAIVQSEIEVIDQIINDLHVSDKRDLQKYHEQLTDVKTKLDTLAIDDGWDRPGREL